MLAQLLILLVAALVLGWARRARSLVLMTGSALAVFWLQPDSDPKNLIFWLPTLTLFLVALTWLVTAERETIGLGQNWQAGLILLAVIVLVDIDHLIDPWQVFTVFTPRWQVLLAAFAVLGLLALVVFLFDRRRRLWPGVALAGILLLFVALKLPAASTLVPGVLARFAGNGEAASLLTIRWLGFSYIAFRLIHTIRDRQAGRLPAVSLAEYVTYVIFFPALNAGPIDRIERFVGELRQPLGLGNEDWVFIIRRVFFGLLKKFVLADFLAFGAINDALAQQVHTPAWMWIVVYAYALQILLDFSGYTDIAIGMGRLMGIRLPENFSAPYLKTNLTQFWNNWHITLTQWFRAYYFNPMTRALRRTSLPAWAVLFLTQVTTMVLIGLWHGISWNFVLWGLWHGLGLFVHNRWSEWQKTLPRPAALAPFWGRVLNLGGLLLTFHFVALGWVFFALSSPALSWHVFAVLFGFSA